MQSQESFQEEGRGRPDTHRGEGNAEAGAEPGMRPYEPRNAGSHQKLEEARN